MTQASRASDPLLLTPGDSYEGRISQAKNAEDSVRSRLRDQKRALIESLLTWLALLGVAWMSHETLAALSSAAWLVFVGWYYMPSAGRDLARSREHLRIRVAYLTVEDAERFTKEQSGYPLIGEMIRYRKELVPCPLLNLD